MKRVLLFGLDGGARRSESEPVSRRAMVELIATMETFVAGELKDGMREDGG